MLRRVQHFFRSIFVKIIFGLLLLSFVFWGVGSFSLSLLTSNALVEIGSQEYTESDFVQFSQQQLDRLGLSQIPAPQLRQAGVYHRLLDDFVDLNLLLSEADDLDVKLPAITTETLVKNNPQFHDDDGNFSLSLFQNAIVTARTSEQILINQLRGSFMSGLIAGNLQRNWRPVSAFNKPLWEYYQQQRDATIYTVPIQSATTDPGDETLKEYLLNQSSTLTIPEQRSGSVLEISGKQIVSAVEVDDADIRVRYEANLPRLTQPERRTVSILAIDSDDDHQKYIDPAKAKQALQTGNAEEFVAITKQKLLEEILLSEVSDAAFAYDAPGILPPFVTDFGTYIIEVNDFIPEFVPPLSNYRDLIYQAITAERANDILYDIIDNIENRQLDLEPFGALAELNPYAQPIAINQQSFDDSLITLSAISPENAFRLAQEFFAMDGEFTSTRLVETENDTFYLFGLDSVTPSVTPTVEEHRDFILTEWQYDEGLNAAIKIAEREKNSPAVSNDLTKLQGLTRNRANDVGEISDQALEKLFEIKSIQDSEIAVNDLTVQLITLTGINIPDIPENWSDTVLNDHQQALTTAYIGHLRAQNNVSIDQGAFDAVLQRLAGS